MASIGQTTRPGYVYDSGTDTWIPIGIGPHSHSDYIPNSIVDAKGDIVAATGNDVPARLAVGNNGETLVADSSTSTGLRYNPLNVMANPVINGGMDIWQRGTSINGADNQNNYSADRWVGYRTGATFSRQTTADTTNLPNLQYCARVQRNSGQTGTGEIFLLQNFETVNSIPFAGKTVTLSFYARRGANFSGNNNVITSEIITGTGTDQNALGGFTGGAATVANLSTLTTTWQRFAYTGTIPVTSTQLAVNLKYSPTGTAGANDYFEVTGVQIDVGTYTASTAPTFRRSGGTLAGELAACQRYYYRLSAVGAYPRFGIGYGVSTTSANILVNFPVSLRTAPTAVETNTVSLYRLNDGVTGTAANNFVIDQATAQTTILAVGAASGLTQYRPYTLEGNNSTAAYLGFSAEL